MLVPRSLTFFFLDSVPFQNSKPKSRFWFEGSLKRRSSSCQDFSEHQSQIQASKDPCKPTGDITEGTLISIRHPWIKKHSCGPNQTFTETRNHCPVANLSFVTVQHQICTWLAILCLGTENTLTSIKEAARMFSLIYRSAHKLISLTSIQGNSVYNYSLYFAISGICIVF